MRLGDEAGMDWITYWDGRPSLYVNARHKAVHYRSIADGILHYLPQHPARVLDYGCGEALDAERVAARCGSLTLCDAAPSVTSELERRFAHNKAIRVCTLDGLAEHTAGSFDRIIVNSVVQYLSPAQLADLMATADRLLAPEGVVLFADIIPPDLGPLGDAVQLLRLAGANGFLAGALVGLVRTLFSDYSRVRAHLGLTKFSEADFVEAMRGHGFAARRTRPNLGHNQQRLAFLVQRAAR